MQRIFALVGGRLLVIVGASGWDDDTCPAIADQAMALEAAGVMIAPKRGLDGDTAVFDYFTALCTQFGPSDPSACRIAHQRLAQP